MKFDRFRRSQITFAYVVTFLAFVVTSLMVLKGMLICIIDLKVYFGVYNKRFELIKMGKI